MQTSSALESGLCRKRTDPADVMKFPARYWEVGYFGVDIRNFMLGGGGVKARKRDGGNVW